MFGLKKVNRFLAILLVLILVFPFNSYAGNYKEDYIIVSDENNVLYKMFSSNDELVIQQLYTPRVGGGIGRCPANKQKKFSYTITKDRAKESKKAIKQGKKMVAYISKAFGVSLGSSTAATIMNNILDVAITEGLDAQSYYESILEEFLESGKSKAKFVFEAECVNRGNMYGDPMYDYVVRRARIEY